MKKIAILILSYVLFQLQLIAQMTNHNSATGQISLSSAEYINDMSKQYNINTATTSIIELDIVYNVEQDYDFIHIYECDNDFNKLDLLATLHGNNNTSVKTSNPNGRVVIVFVSDVGYSGGNIGPDAGFIINWNVVNPVAIAANNSVSNTDQVLLGSVSSAANLRIQDHQSKSLGELNTPVQNYSNAMILLETEFGRKLGISYNKIGTNGNLGIVADGSIYQYANEFIFSLPGKQNALSISASGNINIKHNSALARNVWMNYEIDAQKYMSFASGKLSNGYCNFVDVRNDATAPILYYNIKSPTIGNTFNNQAGLVFDIKYTNSEAGVGDNTAFLVKSGWSNRLLAITGNGDAFIKRKLGIGKKATCELDVNGNIKAHEIEVTLAAMQDLQLNGTLAANNITYTANGNTADFVFEDNYQLKDLAEVEAFIKTNKHLPEIPSAAKMEEAGVNLAEMNKLLLMKVEELTLYLIEQHNEIELLKTKLKQVKND